MNDQSIELVIIFKENELSSIPLFNYFRETIPKFFGIGFNEISYSVKGKNNKKREKSLKYKTSNLEKYINELTDNDGGFELSNYLTDIKFKSRDINVSISYNPHMYLDDSSSIIITLNKNLHFNNNGLESLKSFYIQMLNFLIKIQKKITYGFITSIENMKFPALFVAGIGNYNLSKKEEEELQVWTNKNSESVFKIWRVFWGNLITI
ncbi:MAG TPA: hypothetical protein VN704_12920, partial [Verrucomicrobiae bacterium]|nr:hypothetical protein [Verrucomicrobiae bacterium]